MTALVGLALLAVIMLAHVVDIWGALVLSAVLWIAYALIVRAQNRRAS